MTACAIASIAALGFSSVSLLSADGLDVPRTLHGIEERYNRTQTLQLSFTESYQQGARTRVEKGELYLRKPGRMRWQYTAPAGKLFVSDGKFIYSYAPQDNRAEKMKLQETDDMRAPLAFLLGRLDFHKDFREFHAHPEDGGIFITAIPKSDKLPYSEVSFLAAPDFTIRRLEVKGQDNSVLRFTFENEKKDPALQDALFRFTPPPGAEYVDSSNQP
ncbi:MAG: outer membrane lipoprotein carrier protein LolA [Acidobacteriota bacterium]|nr:outer membrane lipoprotein carrier protein LolA [Acidobacteriota bacterium]